MEIILNTKEQLIEKIKDVRAVEIVARDSYTKDTKLFTNITLVDVIDRIRDDEIRHILLLDEILELLQK